MPPNYPDRKHLIAIRNLTHHDQKLTHSNKKPCHVNLEFTIHLKMKTLLAPCVSRSPSAALVTLSTPLYRLPLTTPSGTAMRCSLAEQRTESALADFGGPRLELNAPQRVNADTGTCFFSRHVNAKCLKLAGAIKTDSAFQDSKVVISAPASSRRKIRCLPLWRQQTGVRTRIMLHHLLVSCSMQQMVGSDRGRFWGSERQANTVGAGSQVMHQSTSGADIVEREGEL
ncbi:hypothetical protein P154DRAFT_576722 [Amniculicola lignicola CBS 123094]|uniref:Uncharacterized protein n=1 Tax=Amniculicola lignicola CBS 123094 TaxID=1392246 RepID=A0A6A5WL35_9PLEO|nr:hypothetical protein P154DRAFT_576722 [Amniculicola lignicola CBS 123094]